MKNMAFGFSGPVQRTSWCDRPGLPELKSHWDNAKADWMLCDIRAEAEPKSFDVKLAVEKVVEGWKPEVR